MILKNQKLEQKVRDLEHFKKESHELKVSRDKQQVEFKTLYEDKQKLYGEIMDLKEQVTKSRSETKEKIMSIQFVEKEKQMLQTQIEELQKTIKKHEVDVYKLQNQVRSLESKNLMTDEQL